jgi:hypothetical protein
VGGLPAGRPVEAGHLPQNIREKDQQSKALEERLYVTSLIDVQCEVQFWFNLTFVFRAESESMMEPCNVTIAAEVMSVLP